MVKYGENKALVSFKLLLFFIGLYNSGSFLTLWVGKLDELSVYVFETSFKGFYFESQLFDEKQELWTTCDIKLSCQVSLH